MTIGPIVLVTATVLIASMVLGGEDSRRAVGFVSREGNRLYLDGHPYRFVGVNIPWANGCGPPVSDETLDRALDRVSRSANAVRVFFFQNQATFADHRDWTAFDRTLRAIADHGLKVIVTLGDQHGSCGDPGGFKDVSWYKSGYADALTSPYPQTYRDYVRDLVRRYGDRPEILAWQLINEATVLTPGVDCADETAAAHVLRSWADDVAGLIRSIDPHHLISLGTGLQGGCGYAVTGDPASSDYAYVHSGPNIDLCEYHDYNLPEEPLPEPERQEMDACASLRKPFFVGELGIENTHPDRSALIDAKLSAEFNFAKEPLQGALIWELGSAAVGVCDQYCVRPSDPLLNGLGHFEKPGS